MAKHRTKGVGVLAALGLAVVALMWPVPDAWFQDVSTRTVVDRRGRVLAEAVVPSRGRGTWVELDDIAPEVVDALLAAEDDRFFSHIGIDLRALARATSANLRARRVVQGGSTLSQQTARLLAGRSGGWTGKAVEGWRALRLERTLEKEDILTWYLNRAYFGANSWGIEAAARATFDESAAGLSLAEAATLVGVLPAPSRLHPHRDRASALSVRDRVLDRMLATKRRTSQEIRDAKAEPMELRTPHRDPIAPHFSRHLLGMYPSEQVLSTTLDGGLQEQVEAQVTAHLSELRNKDVDHAAVVVIEVETGAVRAWVGSGGLDEVDGHVDGARALRSPGSSLKPFLYGLAFEAGGTPADVVADIPKAYQTSHGTWTPANYSGRFHGPVRAREALACSFNVPAVVLLEQVGVATLASRLGALGLDLPERPAHYGLGLILGDAEVSLGALTNAYAALARGGVYRPMRRLTSDPMGEEVRVFEPRASWWITDILSDRDARLRAFGRYGPLERPYPAAAKTGTSTGFRDNWTVGYTPSWVVGVWVGNFDSRPMGDVSGVTGAGPLWGEVMDLVSSGQHQAFPLPTDLENRPICALSGGAPTESCPIVIDEWLQSPAAPCVWHKTECEVDWPSEFAAWAAEADAGSGCRTAGEVAIASPGAGATFYLDPRLPLERQRIPLRALAPAGARRAEWRVDGQVVASIGRPFETLWRPNSAGQYKIDLRIDGRDAPSVDVWVGGIQEER